MLFGGGFYLSINKNEGIASLRWMELWLWKLIQLEGGLTFKRGQRNALKSLEMKVTFLLRKTHSKPV
ncbi:hypothetical protein SAMN05518670_6397 [Paenibacillus sp. OK076]|nr:hypothetical protein SAMN05518670_6397 [Paenibacillus sp. OK076]